MIPDWLEITPLFGNGNGKLTFTAGPNTGLDRSASVDITDANGKSETFHISQAGHLTVIADMIHPTQRMYTTIRSDLFYDNFKKIESFNIAFTQSDSGDTRFILPVDYFSEDGENCYSGIVSKESTDFKFSFRIVAVRMLADDNYKYIQLATIYAET